MVHAHAIHSRVVWRLHDRELRRELDAVEDGDAHVLDEALERGLERVEALRAGVEAAAPLVVGRRDDAATAGNDGGAPSSAQPLGHPAHPVPKQRAPAGLLRLLAMPPNEGLVPSRGPAVAATTF